MCCFRWHLNGPRTMPRNTVHGAIPHLPRIAWPSCGAVEVGGHRRRHALCLDRVPERRGNTQLGRILELRTSNIAFFGAPYLSRVCITSLYQPERFAIQTASYSSFEAALAAYDILHTSTSIAKVTLQSDSACVLLQVPECRHPGPLTIVLEMGDCCYSVSSSGVSWDPQDFGSAKRNSSQRLCTEYSILS